MIRTLRSLILPALLGLGILAVLGLLGSALVLYRAAADTHPLLGYAVVGALLSGFVLLLVVPTVRILRLPRGLIRPAGSEGPAWDRFVRAYGRRLLRNARIREAADRHAALDGARGGGVEALAAEVEASLGILDAEARRIIAGHAAAVFAATAVSQSGRLDTVIVLSAQIRMIRELAELYFQRPSVRELTRLYANVGAAAFVAGELEDSELLAVLGAPVSAGIASLIPIRGTDPLVSLLVHSMLEGSANAFLTLRVGVLARRFCGLRLEPDRRKLARSASLEAAELMGSVVGEGAGRVAGTMRRAVARTAVSAPKRVAESAARGTSRAAQGIANIAAALFGAAERLGVRAAGKAGEMAAGPAELGKQGLEIAAAFWEDVASRFRAEGGEAPSLGPDR